MQLIEDVDRIPEPNKTWLLKSGSLTRHFRELTQNQIQFLLNHNDWGSLIDDEGDLLQLKKDAPVWVRQLNWVDKHQTWVVARAVIPQRTLEKIQASSLNLEVTSLGDILFANSTLKRSDFQVFRLQETDTLFQLAQPFLHAEDMVNSLWMRRSIFNYDGCPLLVIETFLPAFFKAITTHDEHHTLSSLNAL